MRVFRVEILHLFLCVCVFRVELLCQHLLCTKKPRDADVACTHNTTHTKNNKQHIQNTHNKHTYNYKPRVAGETRTSPAPALWLTASIASRPPVHGVWGSAARRWSQRAGPGGKFATLITLELSYSVGAKCTSVPN